VRGGLIRALYRSAKTKTVALDEVACQNPKQKRLVPALGGITTHSTGARVSEPFIENLRGFGGSSRPVNSGVMSPLRIASQLIPAAPQLNDNQLVWIMREAGRSWMQVESDHDERTWHSASAITRQVKSAGVRRGGRGCYNITSRSTRPLDSIAFIVL
jgi:hypothetical protein